MRLKRIAGTGLSVVLLLLLLPIAWVMTFTALKCSKTRIDVPVQDYTSKIDGLTVYYRVAGDPETQPIVFLHGLGARRDGPCGNDGVIAALAEHFYVIAPEHPGFIRSEPPKAVWTFEEYAHALRALLLPLKLPKFILMSQSWGGGIASMYAKFYPDEVQTLVFVDAKIGSRRENWYTRLRYVFNDFFAGVLDSRVIPLAIKQSFISLSMGAPKEILTEDASSKYKVMGEILHRAYNFSVDYAALPMPILLIWGDRDTWVSDMERAKQVAQEAKHGKFLTVPGSHTVLYQRPKEVVELIVSSLKNL